MRISEPRALASLTVTPWKNGGGSTRVLAVEPPESSNDDFRWRISLADVDAPGDFSIFAGVDRTILLWGGKGLMLRAASWTYSLDQRLLPFSFRGEQEIHCDLIAGPTTDLNVMVRRGAAHAALKLYDHEVALSPAAETRIILCVSGTALIHPGNITLNCDHFVRIDDCGDVALRPAATGAALLVITLQERAFGN